MNIHEGLEENFKFISSFNGVCLNIEERVKLEIALNDLHMDIKSDEMWFWGKINGVDKDYYIALAIFFKGRPMFPEKKFYFCNSSNFVFSELSELKSHHFKDFGRFNTYFIGNPDVIYETYDNINESTSDLVDEEENEEVYKPKLKLKNLTESDRLSFIVRSIDLDAFIVPEGSFKMLLINEMRRNDNFTGVNAADLTHFSKYLHFRHVENKNKKDIINMGEAVFNFLDSIDEDSLKDCWSVQTDPTRTIVNIRSLLWPGYFAYHKANSKLFGSCYFGHGLKNMDLSFML